MNEQRRPQCQWFGCRELRDYRLQAYDRRGGFATLDVCLVHMTKGIAYLTTKLADREPPNGVTQTAYLDRL